MPNSINRSAFSYLFFPIYLYSFFAPYAKPEASSKNTPPSIGTGGLPGPPPGPPPGGGGGGGNIWADTTATAITKTTINIIGKTLFFIVKVFWFFTTETKL